jgi:hypothetical protein
MAQSFYRLPQPCNQFLCRRGGGILENEFAGEGAEGESIDANSANQHG